MQPLQICIGPTIRIGRESWCLPHAGFFCFWTPPLAAISSLLLLFITSQVPVPACLGADLWDAIPSPTLDSLGTHLVFLWILLVCSFVFTLHNLLFLLYEIVVTLPHHNIVFLSLAEWTDAGAGQLSTRNHYLLQVEVNPALFSARSVQQVMGPVFSEYFSICE